MEQLVQVFFAGVVTGSFYAGLALALVLVYQSTGVINFAQGEMGTLSAYICLTLLELGMSYWIAFGLTLVISYVYASVLERTVMRRFHGRNHLVEVIVLIGLLVTISSVVGAIWTHNVRTFPSPFGEGSLLIMGFYLRRHDLGALAVMLVMLTLVFGFFRFTMTGLSMRASAHNAVSSRLSGIPASSMLSAGWGLAAVVGAVSAMMVAPVTFLDPGMMAGALTFSFAAALLGGVTSPVGAVIGGFIVGLIESVVVALLPSVGNELKLTVALLLIVITLLAFPQGLFGKRTVVRV